jgi:hypothetical protein
MGLIIPTLPEAIRVGFGTVVHHVDDWTVRASLKNDLRAACGPEWYACILMSDGRGLLVPSSPILEAPDREHKKFLMDLALGLNIRAGYMGHWVVAWVTPRKFVAFWRDRDGDRHVEFEDDRVWPQMSQAYGVDTYVEQADQAIRIWADHMSRLEASDWQKFLAAKGEKAPTAH